MTDEIRARNDKIGFHTPLISLLRQGSAWVRGIVCGEQARALDLYDAALMENLCAKPESGSILGGDAGFIWRSLVTIVWADIFQVDCSFGT